MSRILSIEWDEAFVQFVLGETIGSRCRIEKSATHAWPETPEVRESAKAAGEWLAEQIRALGAEGEETIVVLPREAVVVRRLTLPPAPDAEMPDMVRFQASAKLSTPVDRLKIDFLPLPASEGPHGGDGRNVLVAAWDRTRYEFMRSAIAAAGCELVGVTISPTAISYLVPQVSELIGHDPSEPLLIVMHDGRRIEIVIIEHSIVIFTHQSRLSEGHHEDDLMEVLQEIQRAVMAFEQNHPGIEVGQVVLLEADEEEEDLATALEVRFGSRMHRLSRDDFSRVLGRALPDGGSWPRILVPLGGLQHHLVPGDQRIDLFNPRRAPPQVDIKRLRMIQIGVGTAAVLLLGAIWMTWQMITLNSEIAELQESRADLNQLIERGLPNERSLQSLEEWESGTFQPLALLRDLQSHLPGTERSYLTDFKVTPEPRQSSVRIDANGRAVHRDVVATINHALSEARYGFTPRVPTDQTTRDPDYPVGFEIEVVPSRESFVSGASQSRPANE